MTRKIAEGDFMRCWDNWWKIWHEKLHKRLDDAMSELSGNQQIMFGRDNIIDELESALEGQQEIKDCLLDIIQALGFEVDESTLIDPSQKCMEKDLEKYKKDPELTNSSQFEKENQNA